MEEEDTTRIASELNKAARQLSRVDVSEVKSKMGSVEVSLLAKCFAEEDNNFALKLAMAVTCGVGLGVLVTFAIPNRFKCQWKCD